MTRKFQFYQRYGIEEYYIYDPDNLTLDGYLKQGACLELIDTMQNWVSPQLGIQFGLTSEGKLELIRPDGQPFETYEQIAQRAEQLTQRAEQTAQQLQEAEAEIERLREQLRLAQDVTPQDPLGQNPEQP
jgi:hypothetical protein